MSIVQFLLNKLVVNPLTWLDIQFNAPVRRQQMLDNGFFTADKMTKRELYAFFRR